MAEWNDYTAEFREVDETRWQDLVRLFEARGGPSYCWCMAWRGAGKKTVDKKAALKGFVVAKVPIGILGYADGEPVAWCSLAPRETYRPLGGPDSNGDDVVWSIACFYVARPFRRLGWTRHLIEAASNHAKRHGASIIEAYPVDEDSPSYRFMGFKPVFESNGFEEVGRAGKRRHVMRRRIQ